MLHAELNLLNVSVHVTGPLWASRIITCRFNALDGIVGLCFIQYSKMYGLLISKLLLLHDICTVTSEEKKKKTDSRYTVLT